MDENIYQGTTPTCAIRSQQIILRDYGIQIPQEELKNYAEQQGWYDEVGGTSVSSIGNLLTMCGVGVHVTENNTFDNLLRELNAGHRVIVGVDARELWAEPESKEHEFFSSIEHADHALIVAGIRFDTLHPEQSVAILTDPGRGDAYIEYPLEHFRHAWGDSHFYMMATNEPAPYQYNAETQSMEASPFQTSYTISKFPFHNEFSHLYDMGSNQDSEVHEDDSNVASSYGDHDDTWSGDHSDSDTYGDHSDSDTYDDHSDSDTCSDSVGYDSEDSDYSLSSGDDGSVYGSDEY